MNLCDTCAQCYHRRMARTSVKSSQTHSDRLHAAALLEAQNHTRQALQRHSGEIVAFANSLRDAYASIVLKHGMSAREQVSALIHQAAISNTRMPVVGSYSANTHPNEMLASLNPTALQRVVHVVSQNANDELQFVRSLRYIVKLMQNHDPGALAHVLSPADDSDPGFKILEICGYSHEMAVPLALGGQKFAFNNASTQTSQLQTVLSSLTHSTLQRILDAVRRP